VDFFVILLIVLGLLAPIGVAVMTVVAGIPKGGRVGRGMPLAFGKGLALGAVMGLAVCAVVIAIVLGVARILGR
jgi:hypothetical protein